MAAPDYAEPIGTKGQNVSSDGQPLPMVHCPACGWRGETVELLGVDPDEDPTLWCPQCGTSGWEYE